ncbi:atypical/PIKK/TRRAP protein kinase [Irpex rosettiformis]|uniref:Atypical/PIKK/TRRAP protein kinase n=1 Tax=Irpex rosettiformis TaxID=378272 RepID=A0ACB8UDL6_9APHY|nr:atypical/PIKK/TRRAP protein kinase [Irpex rosettiformis]
MDGLSQFNAADLESRAARVADPSIDLKTKVAIATELRDIIDAVKDPESARVIPHMIPVLLDCLRSGEPSYQKDSLEYVFRKTIVEVLHRIPVNDVIRSQAHAFFTGVLHVLRTDNEENAVICSKILLEMSRGLRPLADDLVKEWFNLFHERCRSLPSLVESMLSDSSPPIDPLMILPSMQSIKILHELCTGLQHWLSSQRPVTLPLAQESMQIYFEVVDLVAPAQKTVREAYEEKAGNIWSGVAPTIRNVAPYIDMISAQIRIVSFMAMVFRASGQPQESYEAEIERLLLITVRLLQDTPTVAITARKDLLLVFRHFITFPQRRCLVPYVDKILDEGVLLGSTISSQETVRNQAYSCVTDLMHHLRLELAPYQIRRICTMYMAQLHNSNLGNQLHSMVCKGVPGMADAAVTKDTPQNASKLLGMMFESIVGKLESMAIVHKEVTARLERIRKKVSKEDPDEPDLFLIEKSRPAINATYAVEKPEDLLLEYRVLYRTIIHALRGLLSSFKKCDGTTPDSLLVGRLFEGLVNGLLLFDLDTREYAECMDHSAMLLAEFNLHVFQEVWTTKMDFIFQAVERRPTMITFSNHLFGRETHSPTLVAIVLNYCLGRLDKLGDMDELTAAVCIKWFKTVFTAVTLHPQSNEPILANHLSKLIMDCFPLAAKSSRPTNYYHLLRTLFRAIGGGGGRFEILYKEALPLLPEMLECLQKQLLASEGYARDMLVELCLTVPLRLTHLIPYLNYLMKPLAFALRGSPELVSQGLRTLELCIDNLQPDFLDPTLNTILRELMEALYSHLKPLPANHLHAHTTIRILGKLGGRNRRLLERPPELQYRVNPESTKVRFTFAGSPGSMEVGPTTALACYTLNSGRTGVPYREHAFNVLEVVATLLVSEGVKGRDREDVLLRCLEGILDAIHIPEFEERVITFIRSLAQHIFDVEIRKGFTREGLMRRAPSPLLSIFLDALLQHGLVRSQPQEAAKAEKFVSGIISGLFDLTKNSNLTLADIKLTVQQVATRVNALCLEDSWAKSSAGCVGVRLLVSTELGTNWVNERVVDVTRTLLHVLKGIPYELPTEVEKVKEVMFTVLRLSVSLTKTDSSNSFARTNVSNLVGIYFGELQGQNPTIRKAAQESIEMISQLLGVSTTDILMPQRDRMLTAIYTKPLRALPFAIQIGMIDAVRYCLSLDPPLPELNEELLRLLHEALALADAEDSSLMNRMNQRQSAIEIVKLRVACIKLLTAAMPLTDYFSKQNTTRQRVTSVYFKSLYSNIPEVKEVAHDGLRLALKHQNRLPKDLLQTGLRPILMNLADPKRLSVSGLEGLARLLQLLTNYFKVEIGHKLLDHFRVVADPQMLQQSSRLPMLENEGILKLNRLVNIFHLLPPAANIFLENLVNAVVQTEAQMHFSGKSPFSEPLAKYLDRYPTDAIDFFMRHLQFPRHVRTLRSILQANLAPKVLQELLTRTPTIVTQCFEGRDPSLVQPGLLLCYDLADIKPDWLTKNDFVIQALLSLWRAGPPADNALVSQGDILQRYTSLTAIFVKALEQSRRVDLLFDLVDIFTRQLPLDLIYISQFLYQHVALNPSLHYRRNVLTRFLVWFKDRTYSYKHKTYVLRYIITPTILVNAARLPKEGLLDSDMIQWFHTNVWTPMNEDPGFSTDDIFIIELLHVTTVLVHQYPELLSDAKKDIIKCAWHYINREDALVKHTAYLLAARALEAWEGPAKFYLTAWTGLLSRPQIEGKALIRQALDILAPVLMRAQSMETGYPQWAKPTRRLLAEESGGWSQVGVIYGLMCRHSSLFYPVRSLFIPHIVNYVAKLGLQATSSLESRILSVDILQVVFEWDKKAATADAPDGIVPEDVKWSTPLALRESIVSYLMRLATTLVDVQSRAVVTPRVLNLLRALVGSSGWTDVTVKLHYFARALQLNDLNGENMVAAAQASAKVLNVVTTEKPDAWFTANADILTKLVRKGLVSEDVTLHDALHPIFDRLIHLYPLPKDDEGENSELGDFFVFVRTTIGDGLRNATNVRGVLLMLKSVVQANPERIQLFTIPLMKLLGAKAKDHLQSAPNTIGYDNSVRHMIIILEICQVSIAYLGEQRKQFLAALQNLVEKSKSGQLCKFILDTTRTWALNSRDTFPSMKDKAQLLLKMVTFEYRSGERGEHLHQSFLELIYEIYTEPTLRRSDLTARLEQAFLLGCRAADSVVRERFINLLDSSIPRSLFARLSYIFGVQNWSALSDRNWISLALHLLLSCVDVDSQLMPDRRVALDTALVTSPFTLGKTSSFIHPTQRLLFSDPERAHDVWVSVFPSAWANLTRREQVDVTHHLIGLLSKDYHISQAEQRPNVIQTLLTGIQNCSPPITLPPHLVKYLAKTFGAWHASMQILESSLDYVRDDELIVRDAVYDSLSEVYAELSEEDLFYGLWRRRCLYPDTNMAIAYEQIGMWDQASTMYETAQNKSRSGLIPFSEPEYCLWEDHWILAQQKLQQWDTLYELGRSENNHELVLESAWRVKDWTEQRETLEEQISLLPSPPTPRKRVFEAFVTLLKSPGAIDKNTEFTKFLEDGMQLALRKWNSLPHHMVHAHIPLLQLFQQFVELQEAVQIFGSLSTTTAQNLEKKSSDLKMVLQAWRERLPNICDDITIWSDLVSWRQNVFDAINKTYIPLINSNPQAGATAGTTNTYGYRGYHETAWIINRFAHVARKHDLLEVCFSSLNKIYTLPNIEISEAFLKLREQARCHYQKPGDLAAGLEVINNTNLMYFSTEQKAEFYMLKGMFFAKFDRHEEAGHAFGSAVQLDINQPKAWGAWGKYSDRMFQEHPTEMPYASNAVSCYLQAAGLYKNHKSRPFLTRILWLLGIDDASLTISRAFDTYKGDAAFWYWITLIPQLLMSISHREVKQARYILLNLAKLYPQALFFHLRVNREEMNMLRKQSQSQGQRAFPHQQGVNTQEGSQATTTEVNGNGQPVRPSEDANSQARTAGEGNDGQRPTQLSVRQAWEYMEEVGQILKTAFPLLIMSLETIVEQISQRLKSSQEEEVYRLLYFLSVEFSQLLVARMLSSDDDRSLTPNAVNIISRQAHALSGQARKDWEDDFITTKPTFYEFLQRLQQWKDKYEKYVDSRPRIQSMDTVSHYLTDFQYTKYDEVEVFGQYTEDKDGNQYFIKIQKFDSKFENCRSQGFCFRRMTIHGHDHSKTCYMVQPAPGRYWRREDRTTQLCRTFNGVLSRKKESHKRNLQFHCPIAMSIGLSCRLIVTDPSYINLGDIYEQFCDESGIGREDAVFLMGEKMKAVSRGFKDHKEFNQTKPEFWNVKKEIIDEIRQKLIPENVLTRYMLRTMNGPSELWRMRKQFALQIAANSFLTYAFAFSSRHPSRFTISRTSGLITMSELLPGQNMQQPMCSTSDQVPFRLTPNMQHFIGPVFTEGILVSGIMTIARCLSEPEYEVSQQMCLHGRDEVITWHHTARKPYMFDIAFRSQVSLYIGSIVKRIEIMACKLEREQATNNNYIQGPNATPVFHSVTSLISSATNPLYMAKMGDTFMAWF